MWALLLSDLDRIIVLIKEAFNETFFDEDLSQAEVEKKKQNIICTQAVDNHHHEIPCSVFTYIPICNWLVYICSKVKL